MNMKKGLALVSAFTMALSSGAVAHGAEYTVAAGDTVGEIAGRYGISLDVVLEDNEIEDIYKLMPGTVLKIGGLSQDGSTYRMVWGDTLWAIGRELGVSWQEIAELNNITNPNKIRTGTVLALPESAEGTEAEVIVIDVPEETEVTEQTEDISEEIKEETVASVVYTEETVWIENNGYEIPAIVTMPVGEGTYPGVVMLHGTGSDKDEAGGGYLVAAPMLAEAGIASIRIDFLGSGESKEDYVNYNFTTAVSDAIKAAEYLSALDQVDGENMGIMGWSQGGTIAMLAAGNHDIFKSVVTWAGAPSLMGVFTEEGYAEAKEKGFSVMEYDWRDNMNLGLAWYEDVLATDVLAEFSKSTAPVLAINGLEDDVVLPENADKIAEASSNPNSKTLLIENCDHTFNVFSGSLDKVYETVKATADFFNETLVLVTAEEAKFTETVVVIENEGRKVPAAIVTPAGEGPFPAVVINHGHGGSREEGGGFTAIAEKLAEAGILTIRMDFPGCGDSEESFTENTMSNMISDSNACLAYILENCDIDTENLGILGYSMGGRIALTIASEENSPYSAMVVLAPSADDGGPASVNLLGGEEEYNKYYEEAASEKGYAEYTTIYGQEQHLSLAWFEDMKASRPLENIDNFQGRILLIYGDQDVVVSAEVNELVMQARPDAQKIIVKDADHGYGFYSDQPEVTSAVENGIVDFFSQK